MIGALGAFWGLAGVMLLIGSAVYRLFRVGVAAFSYDFFWYHWAGLAFILWFMAYAEGYRAFQQRFSPRVAARAKYLRDHPRLLHSLLAPLFCMGFFHATRRRQVTSIAVTAGVILLVLLVRLAPQPWRGIVDLGVVVGLTWGLVAIVFFSVQAFTSESFAYSPEVPEEERH